MYKRSKMITILIFIILLISISSFAGCERNEKSPSGDGQEAVVVVAEAAGAVDGIVMDDNAAVINEAVCDLFEQPDVKTQRVSQVLYNQPVSIVGKQEGWYEVNAVDGSSGWIKSKYVINDVSSIYGRSYTHRIIITSREKIVYSKPSGGVTLEEVVMGTEFIVFNESGDAYEVYLPGNKTGWLSGSGMIHVDKGSDISMTTGKDFASTVKKFKGMSFLLNGISSQGLDSAGLTYVCALINGIQAPRYLDGQSAIGDSVGLEEAREGDLLFFYRSGSEKPVFSGIVCENSELLYSSSSIGYVKAISLADASLQGYDVKARRLFPN